MEAFEIVESVTFDIVGLASDEWCGKLVYQRRVKLTVAVDLDNDLRTICDGLSIAGHHCAAHPKILLVLQDTQARVIALFSQQLAGFFGACIVDSVDAPDRLANLGDDFEDVGPYFVARDDNGNLVGRFFVSFMVCAVVGLERDCASGRSR